MLIVYKNYEVIRLIICFNLLSFTKRHFLSNYEQKKANFSFFLSFFPMYESLQQRTLLCRVVMHSEAKSGYTGGADPMTL